MELLYLLLRSAILVTASSRCLNPDQIKQGVKDAAACIYLLLNQSSLTVKKVQAENFWLPIDNLRVESEESPSYPRDPEIGPMLKTQWNTALYEAEELQFKSQEADFSPRLKFTDSEMNIFQASDEKCFNLQLFNDLKTSKSHLEFGLALNLASLSMKARSGFHTDSDLQVVFSRFFVKTPASYRDEKLFLVILDFISLAVTFQAPEKGGCCHQVWPLTQINYVSFFQFRIFGNWVVINNHTR